MSSSFPSSLALLTLSLLPNQRFDVLEILTPELTLNTTRFAEVEPILLTPYFALSYGVSFAVLTSAISTVALWHWKDIRDAFSNREVAGDIHVEMLERSYPKIPTSCVLFRVREWEGTDERAGTTSRCSSRCWPRRLGWSGSSHCSCRCGDCSWRS